MYQPHQIAAMSAQLKSGTPLAGVVVPAPKPRRRNLERDMQIALCRWWSGNCKRFGVPEMLLFKIANDGKRTAIGGRLDKLAGLRRGAPDLFLSVPRIRTNSAGAGSIAQVTASGFSGLFLELKTPTGILSVDQRLFIEAARSKGYDAHVARSLEDAKEVITNYLMT